MEPVTKPLFGLTAGLALGVSTEVPTTVNFDDVEPGKLPKGWMAGVTGQGNPKWQVAKDETAPSAPNVLAQTGEGKSPRYLFNYPVNRFYNDGGLSATRFADFPTSTIVWVVYSISIPGFDFDTMTYNYLNEGYWSAYSYNYFISQI